MGREEKQTSEPKPGRPSSLVGTCVIYCGDDLECLRTMPDGCVDLIYIDPPSNCNRNHEILWALPGTALAKPSETTKKGAFDVLVWPADPNSDLGAGSLLPVCRLARGYPNSSKRVLWGVDSHDRTQDKSRTSSA